MHNIKSVTIYLCIIAVIFLSVLIHPAFAQPSSNEIPYVVTGESFNAPVGDTGFAISNDADNLFTCSFSNCLIFRRDLNDVIELSGAMGHESYWSIDNSRLATMDKDYNCPSNIDQPFNVILFETQTGIMSRHCSPTSAILEDWSPFHPHELFVNQILDTNTFQAVSFSAEAFSLSDINQYWGYGDVFWDLETALPIGGIFLKLDDNYKFTSSELQICALPVQKCSLVLDTLSVASVDVFDYKLYKNWILWGGHFSTSGDLIRVDNRPSEIADTALYLTDFHSGITHEIFRFSSLGQSNTYVKKIAWSPDGKTIALGIEIIDYGPLPTLPPAGTPVPTPSYPPGIVLLHLVWFSPTPVN